MYLFHNDYNQACHRQVMEAIEKASSDSVPGYGIDPYCDRAADLIKKACNCPSAAVHFLVGGTQTNMIVITAALRPHQAVIAPVGGHICIHETGAIEAAGHKVVSIPDFQGKLTAEQVDALTGPQADAMDPEHMVQPKMVYISNPTELGTLYSLEELEAISAVCRKNGLYLYVDGARLGYALGAKDYDVTLADFARLCDAFYIGGTKMGTMFGEAVVITRKEIAEDFRYLMKQRGGMLAKGWLLGVQFEAMFTDGLYERIGRAADRMADKIRLSLKKAGFPLHVPGVTNQVFTVMPDDVLEQIGKEFSYAFWERVDESHCAVRFCTSWSTVPEQADLLCQRIEELGK